jgi:phage tail-like protein
MATQRAYPYANFNYIVNIAGETGDGTAVTGGFSDVQGMSTEVTYAEYRPGNSKVNWPEKYPNISKTGTLTLKRGVIGGVDLWSWLKRVRDGVRETRDISVTLQDEAHNAVMTWKFRGAQPQKWTGPTLAGKGGTDVAMEEFVLVYESMETE